MGNIQIESIDRNNWEELKQIRLEALLSDPDAFESTYERSSRKTDEDWKAQAGDPMVYYFLAKEKEQVIGMVGLAKSRDKEDTLELISLYVNKLYRGQGIGKALVNATLQQAKTMDDIKVVKLWVYRDRQSTVDFYKACGFSITGEITDKSDLPKWYHNTFVMEYLLD